MGILSMLVEEINKERPEGDKVVLLGSPAKRIATGCGAKPKGRGRKYTPAEREYALNNGVSLGVARVMLAPDED